MKLVKITPHQLTGRIEVPPSKSVSHRAIIAAALARGTSLIKNVLLSEDMIATCQAVESLGAGISYHQEGDHRFSLRITGTGTIALKKNQVDCNESGSTLRFLIPLLLLQDQAVTITGKSGLASRPLKPYYTIFEQKGINYEHLEDGKNLPLLVQGKLQAGVYHLDGNVSSQFITGLMFALPLLAGDSQIQISGPLESKPYVDITLSVLKDFGIEISQEGQQKYRIKGNQSYRPRDYRVEGDFSQGAFWLVAGTIGQTITCLDLKLASCQGDKAILEIIKEMGGDISDQEGQLVAKPAKTRGTIIDVSQCPDLVPVLAVLASMSEGESRMIRGERLRFKESDRLATTADLINRLGGQARETPDGLIISGVEAFSANRVESYSDHRIAMAAAIASIRTDGPFVLGGAEAVNKSYPHFWQDFNGLGGDSDELSMGQ